MEDEEVAAVKRVSTLLVVSFELPALNHCAQATFALKPSKQQSVFDWLADLLQLVAHEREHDVLGFDIDGSLMKLETLRKRACSYVEELLSEAKLVDDWKSKVRRAGQTMNRMRDAYYKELFHLREQVYQTKQAEKKNETYEPSYALHFDPTEFTMDDEIQRLVAEKTQLMRQEFEQKIKEIESRHSARSKALKDQLENTRMILSRKEDHVDKLNSRISKLECVHRKQQQETELDSAQDQKLSQRSFSKRRTLDPSTMQEGVRVSEHGNLATLKRASTSDSTDAPSDAVRPWMLFLERRFGGLKDARRELSLKYNMEETVGFTEFENLLNNIGYACTMPKDLFLELSGRKPFVKMNFLFEDSKSQNLDAAPALDSASTTQAGTAGRRLSAPLSVRNTDLGAISEMDDAVVESERPPNKSQTMPVRRKATRPATLLKAVRQLKRRGSRAPTLSSEQMMGEIIGDMTLQEPDDASSDASLSDGSDSLPSTHSESSSCADSTFSIGSERKQQRRKLKRRSTCSWGKSKKKETADAETLTELAVDTGIESAYSGPSNSIHCFRVLKMDTAKDQGTLAMPYELTFPKLVKTTRATQSQIDGRMLDKAIEFYDKEAESNWNQLAGIMAVESDEHEDGISQATLPGIHREGDKDDVMLAKCKLNSMPLESSESDSDERVSRPACKAQTWAGLSSLQHANAAAVTKEALLSPSSRMTTATANDSKECRVEKSGFADIGVQVGNPEPTCASMPLLMELDKDQTLFHKDEPTDEKLEAQLKQVAEFTEALVTRLPSLHEQAKWLGTEAASRGLAPELQLKLQDQLKRLADTGCILAMESNHDLELWSQSYVESSSTPDPISASERARVEAEVARARSLLERHGYAIDVDDLDKFAMRARSPPRGGHANRVATYLQHRQPYLLYHQQQHQNLKAQHFRRLMRGSPWGSHGHGRASPALRGMTSPNGLEELGDEDDQHPFVLTRYMQQAVNAQATKHFDLGRQTDERVRQRREHADGCLRIEQAQELAQEAGLTPGWSGLVQSEFQPRTSEGLAEDNAGSASAVEEPQPAMRVQRPVRRAVKVRTLPEPSQRQELSEAAEDLASELKEPQPAMVVRRPVRRAVKVRTLPNPIETQELSEATADQNLLVSVDEGDVDKVCRSESLCEKPPLKSPSLSAQASTAMAFPDSLNAMRTSLPVPATSPREFISILSGQNVSNVTPRGTLPSLSSGKPDQTRMMQGTSNLGSLGKPTTAGQKPMRPSSRAA